MKVSSVADRERISIVRTLPIGWATDFSETIGLALTFGITLLSVTKKIRNPNI